jgi:hypothetical protein
VAGEGRSSCHMNSPSGARHEAPVPGAVPGETVTSDLARGTRIASSVLTCHDGYNSLARLGMCGFLWRRATCWVIVEG